MAVLIAFEVGTAEQESRFCQMWLEWEFGCSEQQDGNIQNTGTVQISTCGVYQWERERRYRHCAVTAGTPVVDTCDTFGFRPKHSCQVKVQIGMQYWYGV